MEEKRIYESGNLHGLYRCKKREELMKKIPQIDKPEMPDITGIIISGIMNFGSDCDTIKYLSSNTIGCDEEDIKIPYDEMNIARTKFLKDVIIKKLTNSCGYSVEALINTFYEFIQTPTNVTKELQAQADIRDVKRYINCESRKPIVIGNPIVEINGTQFSCQNDFIFTGPSIIKTNKRKEGRRYVYDEEEVYLAESVKVFPGKPVVKESSKVIDCGSLNRLELYVMLKTMEQLCKKKGLTDNVILAASYYYLQKNNDSEDRYSEDFFNKGGNVVSLRVRMESMGEIDKIFMPQIKAFLDGSTVSKDICKSCSSRAFCNYNEISVPLSEEERPLPDKLPVLSPNQQKAADALNGFIRVIATAGSGKTTTMAYRIMNLLKHGVAPEKIGCFTFTNAGAAEMRDRINGFCKIAGIEADISKITISTIHSFGDSLLKQYYELLGYKKPPVLINEIQKTKIIEKILSENEPIEELINKYQNFYLDMFNAKGILELVKQYFTKILEGVSAEELQKETGLSNKSIDSIISMYLQYYKYKKEECLIEHADQELGVLKLLKIKPDLFDEVGLEHISVDEYQDTSNIQFEILYAMKNTKCIKSLFIVGDDDQSIYGFRDANVRLISDFFDMIGEDEFDVHLMENRRSTAPIVNFAANIISNNDKRIPKNPVSTKGFGDEVSVTGFADKKEEQAFIVDEIEFLIKEKGKKDSDIAILAPTNAELLTYADALAERGIKSVSINPEPILENTRVSAAISLVKFMLTNNEFFGMIYLNARTNGEFSTLSKEDINKGIVVLQETVKNIKSVSDLFESFVLLDMKEEDEIYQSFLENIRTAKDNAVKQESLHEVCEYIIDFDRFGKKQTARKEKAYNGVVLSTMHSSKGKEWPIVFCSVSKLHGRDLNENDIPEKNRLLFVACTRAKEKLYVTASKIAFKSMAEGEVDNLFLEECYNALPQDEIAAC